MTEPEWTESSVAELLRRHDLRVTSPRVAICRQFLQQHCHYSAQQMHEALVSDHPTLSPNTVYLTLNQLAVVGVIRSFSVDGNTIYDSNTTAHDHVHCRKCGLLKDIESLPGNKVKKPMNMRGWDLEWGTRLWSGVCPECRFPDPPA